MKNRDLIPHSELRIPHLIMYRSPSYLGVFLTFARNSLVRDMTFRANFIIDMLPLIHI